VNFFIPKLMKIRWSFFFSESFAPHFQIKLSTHGSNLNSIFVSMSELELLLLTGVSTQNFNIVDLVKFLEKLHIQIVAVTLKVTSCNQDSMGKTNFIFSTLPFSPWAVLAKWLHVGAPQKI
jgi:hypothetical protein